MDRAVRWYDYITFNIYFFGLTTLAQTNGLIVPLLVQQFVGEEGKGGFYGSMRLWSLMIAVLAQAFWGVLSDRSRLKWGRRRPFILISTLLTMVCIGLTASIAGLTGMTGFYLLFAISIGQQFVANMGQASQQAVIPDLVPEKKRGAFSGIKAMLEIPVPMILVALVVSKVVSGGNLVLGILISMAVLLFAALIAMLIPEQPYSGDLPPFDWQPILRLALMTAVFTIIILGSGWAVRTLGNLISGLGSQTTLIAVMGLAGLAGMLFSVAVGVWFSVRLSIGEEAARKNPAFTWWVVNRLAYFVGAVNLSTFAVYFFQGRLGLVREKAAGPASMLVLVVGLFILLTAAPSGWLSDRFGHKRLVAFAGIVSTIGVLIALSLPNLYVIYAGGVLIGVATGLFYASNWALGTELVPKEEAGRYLGISNLAGAGAGAVGAYIGGPIADYLTQHVPSFPGVGYVLLFAIFAGMFLFSVIALSWVKPAVEKLPAAYLEPAD